MQARYEVSAPFQQVGSVSRAGTAFAAGNASKLRRWPYQAADVLAASISIVLAFLITHANSLPADVTGFLALRVSIKNLLGMVIFLCAWLSLFGVFGLYRRRSYHDGHLRMIAATACGSSCALYFVFTSRSATFGFDAVVWCWLIALTLTPIFRFLLRTIIDPVEISRAPRQLLVVGTGERAARVAAELQVLGNRNYQLLGFVDIHGAIASSPELKQNLLGDLSRLEQVILHNRVEEVLITLPVKSCYAEVQHAIGICERAGVECKYLSDIFHPSRSQVVSEELSGFRVTSLKPTRDDSRYFVKRAIDIAGAAIGLVVCAPLFLIIGLAIKLTSGSPVFFSQERHGRNRRRFRMHKFRTMVASAEQLQPLLERRNEAAGPIFKIKKDPRVTRLGAFLRRTSLDELPQLFNVLKGEMSLVGPRPLPVRDVSKFEEGWLLRRFCVIPGLTGLWQVNGRNTVNFEDWVKQDFEYIDNWSLKLDFQILLKTLPVVWKGTGAV
jgi:exopolysaccharide biosynthesis polyprenyl glycosylphosphotransferase